MIDPALLKKVQQRAFVSTALFLASIASLAYALIFHDGSMAVKFAGFFGGLGIIIFGLISASEREAYRIALRGEAPYAE